MWCWGLVFAGNLVRRPANRDVAFRTVGDLAGADTIMNDVWVGTYPGLGPDRINYIAESIRDLGAAGSARARPVPGRAGSSG